VGCAWCRGYTFVCSVSACLSTRNCPQAHTLSVRQIGGTPRRCCATRRGGSAPPLSPSVLLPPFISLSLSPVPAGGGPGCLAHSSGRPLRPAAEPPTPAPVSAAAHSHCPGCGVPSYCTEWLLGARTFVIELVHRRCQYITTRTTSDSHSPVRPTPHLHCTARDTAQRCATTPRSGVQEAHLAATPALLATRRAWRSYQGGCERTARNRPHRRPFPRSRTHSAGLGGGTHTARYARSAQAAPAAAASSSPTSTPTVSAVHDFTTCAPRVRRTHGARAPTRAARALLLAQATRIGIGYLAAGRKLAAETRAERFVGGEDESLGQAEQYFTSPEPPCPA
jgi:hypothetical protein